MWWSLARKTWVPIYAFYSRRQEIFWPKFRTSRIFISSPSSLNSTTVTLVSQKHNYFAILYNFNTQIGANLKITLYSRLPVITWINLYDRKAHAVSRPRCAALWLVQSYLVTRYMTCLGSVLIGEKLRQDPPALLISILNWKVNRPNKIVRFIKKSFQFRFIYKYKKKNSKIPSKSEEIINFG